jgi:Concanavalin A-like lectin/glucanases superfamily
MKSATTIQIATCFLCFLYAAHVAPAAHATGSYWSLNEGSGTGVNDLLSGNDGVIVGSAGSFSWTSSSSLQLNGRAYVQVPNNPAILEPTSGLYLEAYIRTTILTGNYNYILAKGYSGCDAPSYGIDIKDGKPRFIMKTASGFVDLPSTTNVIIADNQWHKIVATFDGFTMSLAVDDDPTPDVKAHEGSIPYGLPDNDLYIGAYAGPCGSQELSFEGEIKDVMVASLEVGCEETIPIRLGVASMKGCTPEVPHDTCWEALLDVVDYGAGNIFYILPESHTRVASKSGSAVPRLLGTPKCKLLGPGIEVFSHSDFTSRTVTCNWKGTSNNGMTG